MLKDLSTQPTFLQHTAQADGIVISFEVDNGESAYKQARKDRLDIFFKLKEERWKQAHLWCGIRLGW